MSSIAAACCGSAPRLERREIRNHEIHAEKLGLGKHDAGVDQQGIVPADQQVHVHTELAKTSQRNELEQLILVTAHATSTSLAA